MDMMRISWNPCDVAGWKVMLLGYCLKGWKTCHMDYSGAPQAIKTDSVQNCFQKLECIQVLLMWAVFFHLIQDFIRNVVYIAVSALTLLIGQQDGHVIFVFVLLWYMRIYPYRASSTPVSL